MVQTCVWGQGQGLPPQLKKLKLVRGRRSLSDDQETSRDALGGAFSSASPLGSLLSAKLSALQHLHLDFSLWKKLRDVDVASLAAGLTKLTALQHLHLNFHSCSEVGKVGLAFLSAGLAKLTSLQHLHLDLLGCDTVGNEGLASLAAGLVKLTALQRFHLNLARCTSVSDDGLASLAAGLARLTSLHLDLWGCDQVGNEGLASLAAGIATLTSLQHFHLNLRSGSCSEVGDEGLASLAAGFAKLTALQHFHLNLDSCWKVSNEGLGSLAAGLARLTALQHFHLNLWGCLKVGEEGLASLGAGFAELSHAGPDSVARSATVVHHYREYSWAQLVELAATRTAALPSDFRTLPDPPDITEMPLGQPDASGFGPLEVPTEAFVALQDPAPGELSFVARLADIGCVGQCLDLALHQCLSLQHLDLLFVTARDPLNGWQKLAALSSLRVCGPFESPSWQALSAGLPNMHRLVHLELVHWAVLSETDLQSLAEGLSHLTSMSHFHLASMTRHPIIDGGLLPIAAALQKLPALRHFQLSSWDLGGDIIASLATLSNLQSLRLGLVQGKIGDAEVTAGGLAVQISLPEEWCSGLLDQALGSIGSSLGALCGLQHFRCLEVGLGSCQKVGDAGLQSFSAGLAPLLALERLQLSFSSERIGDQGLAALATGLAKLTSLESCDLDCRGCTVGESGVELLAAMSTLPHLHLRVREGKGEGSWRPPRGEAETLPYPKVR